MGFFQWLLGKAPDRFEPPPVSQHWLTQIDDEDPQDRRAASPVAEAPLFAPPRTIEPNQAYATPAPTPGPTEKTEALAFIIEYEPTPGTVQRRRIRLLGVSNASASPWINAICYERKQVRTFRLDRIRAIISPQDGTVHDPVRFSVEVAGVKPELLQSSSHNPALALAGQLRDQLRAPLSVLVTAARCDGVLDPREIAAIMAWAKKDVAAVVREGFVRTGPKAEAMVILRDMAVTLRPDPADLETYIKTIRSWDNERRAKNLVEAMVAVMKADGTVTDTELAFVNEFNRFGEG